MSGQSIPTEDSENVPQMYGNCGFCHTPLKQQQIIAILGGLFPAVDEYTFSVPVNIYAAKGQCRCY